jgi:transposase
VRRRALVQLRSVIVTAPDRLREQLQAPPERRLPERCSHLRRSSSCPVDGGSKQRRRRPNSSSARSSATCARSHHGCSTSPALGPIVAADVIAACSHQGRVRSEAAFARLAGVAPVPASSGHTVQHRLSRGGDRQPNRALHTVVLHRRQHDPATRAYLERRVSAGKSRRDATRLLKRYLARHLHRLLQQTEPLIA